MSRQVGGGGSGSSKDLSGIHPPYTHSWDLRGPHGHTRVPMKLQQADEDMEGRVEDCMHPAFFFPSAGTRSRASGFRLSSPLRLRCSLSLYVTMSPVEKLPLVTQTSCPEEPRGETWGQGQLHWTGRLTSCRPLFSGCWCGSPCLQAQNP